jgi:hypothetical protein
VLFYRAALLLSHQTLTFVSGVIRRHRKSIGSRWRKLNPGQQALVVLAYLRNAGVEPGEGAQFLPGGGGGPTLQQPGCGVDEGAGAGAGHQVGLAAEPP